MFWSQLIFFLFSIFSYSESRILIESSVQITFIFFISWKTKKPNSFIEICSIHLTQNTWFNKFVWRLFLFYPVTVWSLINRLNSIGLIWLNEWRMASYHTTHWKLLKISHVRIQKYNINYSIVIVQKHRARENRMRPDTLTSRLELFVLPNRNY